MSVDFSIKIANRIVEIKANYESTRDFCQEYITESPRDFTVEISEKDIAFEKEMNRKEAETEGIECIEYSDAYMETLALYRKISTELIDYDTLLFHGSAVSVDGVAYIFTAKSGTGKSTHAGMWRKYFGDRAQMINDDKPLLQIDSDGVTVFGTPWNGKHRLGDNISAPVKAIAILERDLTNHISQIDKKEALPMLIQQSFRPMDVNRLMKAMALIDKLGDGVKLYRLGCNMDSEAVTVSYNGMNEGGKESEIKG